MDRRVSLLLEVLEQAYSVRGWHGTTLKGALRGVTASQALRRPAPGRHSIWELVLHTAYWKYAVRRRLSGARRGAFPRDPSNWPHPPARPDAKAWAADRALLDAEHRELLAVVRTLGSRRLEQRGAKKEWRNVEMIHGVAAHDLYHTGQIQLIKRLIRA